MERAALQRDEALVHEQLPAVDQARDLGAVLLRAVRDVVQVRLVVLAQVRRVACTGWRPCSRIHATATEVSRPPENARPMRSPFGQAVQDASHRPLFVARKLGHDARRRDVSNGIDVLSAAHVSRYAAAVSAARGASAALAAAERAGAERSARRRSCARSPGTPEPRLLPPAPAPRRWARDGPAKPRRRPRQLLRPLSTSRAVAKRWRTRASRCIRASRADPAGTRGHRAGAVPVPPATAPARRWPRRCASTCPAGRSRRRAPMSSARPARTARVRVMQARGIDARRATLESTWTSSPACGSTA